MPRKDYQKRNLKNPFFRKKENSKKKKHFLYFSIFLAVLALFFYILFYSPLFVIKNIRISGTERIADYLIEDLVWQETQNRHIFDIKGNNLWFFSTNNLEEEILKRLDISDVSIRRSFPRTIRVRVNEREAFFILKVADNYQFRDQFACPINNLEVNDNDLKIYPILAKNSLNEDDLDTCLSIDSSYTQDISQLYKLNKDFNNFEIKKFVLNNEVYNINLILTEGPRVFFSRREDFQMQLEKLRLICQQISEDDESLDSIEYIDVRYGNKAFINYK